jgi:uncharacterized protein YggU (UPF0235/DUF167 family)
MGLVTVRVRPRASRTEVTADGREIRVSVRAPAEGGRATEEARRALADALGVPVSRVVLRRGARSRVKQFDVQPLSGEEVRIRLGAT